MIPHRAPHQRSFQDPQSHDHPPDGGDSDIQANAAPDHPIAPGLSASAIGNPSQPQLPPWTPDHCTWSYPTGRLTWSNCRRRNPYVQDPRNIPTTTTDDYPAPQSASGNRQPPDGIPHARIQISHHIVPNQYNPNLPWIDWNVAKHPSTAKRLTPTYIRVDIDCIFGDAVTNPETYKVVVKCDVGLVSILWGSIVIDKTGSARPVIVRDLLKAVYAYFQVQMTQEEVQYVRATHPSDYRRMVRAYSKRCQESDALPGWEGLRGLRRVDVLGDLTCWWGAWATICHDSWWLELEFMKSVDRVPFP